MASGRRRIASSASFSDLDGTGEQGEAPDVDTLVSVGVRFDLLCPVCLNGWRNLDAAFRSQQSSAKLTRSEAASSRRNSNSLLDSFLEWDFLSVGLVR
ncbi:hypothetical protein B0G69_2815 [Paraburkholderia sp. RAU2J]|nr:hypothetical protein B0G69_2815 [Paraburkholderia sp. RAU2J]